MTTEEAGGAPQAGGRRLTTIMAADLCRFAALSEDRTDEAARIVDALTARISRVVAVRGGRIFHRAGDGFLIEMPSATEGLAAARDLSAELRRDPLETPTGPARLRIGLHTGEVREDAGGDLIGHAVNLADRLRGEAAEGGIVLSEASRALLEGGEAARVPLRRMGDLKLKNIRQPVTAFEVAPRQGVLGWLNQVRRTAWVRRNKGPLIAGVVLVAVLNAYLVQDAVRRGSAREAAALAEAEAAARAEALDAQIARLSAQLAEAQDPGDLVAREAVEQAAASLLRSDDPLKAEAARLAVEGQPLAAAQALRAVYDAQSAAGAPPAALAETAVQCGAFAVDRDQSLALWAYERASERLPGDPLVLLRLSQVLLDLGRDADARAALTALLGTAPETRYVVRAEETLASIAKSERRFAEAEARLKRALSLAQAENLSRQEAYILQGLGSLSLAIAYGEDAERRADLPETSEARAYLDRSLRIFRAMSDTDGVVSVLGMLAPLSEVLGEHDEALRQYEEQLALLRDEGNQPKIASAAFNLSNLLSAHGDAPARDAALAVAFEAAQKGRVDGMVPFLRLAQARYAALDGRDEQACELLAEALAGTAEENPNVETMISSLGDARSHAGLAPLPCVPG